MLHIEFLVEELSAEKALHNLLPKIITGEHTYKIITYQGKHDMLAKLPYTLKGYAKWIDQNFKIVVLIDRDNMDCFILKEQLEHIANEATLSTKSSVDNNASYTVLNRIAIEELESWFFGDANAVRSAYPRVSANFEQKSTYRNPDNIQGGTWEALERILQVAGYFRTGIRKTEVANEISKHMQPLNNRSKSFQVFWDGITDTLSLNEENH
ncbi:MAG: DUF4276 family protein [Bacteroidales bacterium]